MQSDQKLLAGVNGEKREKLIALKAARDALKVDSPQYQERNAELLKASIEYESWGKINEANIQRDQKLQMRRLFEKIEQGVAEVAKKNGYDLVLTDQHPDLPDDVDQINLDQLRTLINSRNVIYTSEKIDISSDVLAVLDARYRAAPQVAAGPAACGPGTTCCSNDPAPVIPQWLRPNHSGPRSRLDRLPPRWASPRRPPPIWWSPASIRLLTPMRGRSAFSPRIST